MAHLDPLQIMTARALNSAPRRSLSRLAADWFSGGDLPAWPQFRAGTTVLTYRCRTAIALVCRLLGLQEGDEVLVPAYNCGSEIDPLLRQGLRVVLYRVDEGARIDGSDVARRVTRKTRAILVIHYFGWAQDLQPLVALCRDRGLYLIEDCAHSLFSASDDGWLGTQGDVAVFSLAKTLPIPHGGVAVLRSVQSYTDARFREPDLRTTMAACLPLVKHSVVRSLSGTPLGALAVTHIRRRFRRELLNRNIRPSRPELPADYYFNEDGLTTGASRVVRGALANITPDRIIDIRRRNYQRLVEAIQGVESMRPLFASLAKGTCPLHLPVFVERRRNWINALTARGVYALPWWEGYHRELDWTGFAEAAMLKDGILTLPIHQDLTDADIDLIGESVQHGAYLLNGKRPHGGTAAMQNRAAADRFVGQVESGDCRGVMTPNATKKASERPFWRYRSITRYYIRKLVFAGPTAVALRRLIPRARRKRGVMTAEQWDQALQGRHSAYLGNTTKSITRNSLIGSLAHLFTPAALVALDVGCAGGTLADELAKRGCMKYVGVDISEYAIKHARTARYDGLAGHATFHVANLTEFELTEPSTFGLIVFNEVLYYLGVNEAVGQVARYAKWLDPDGLICVSMKNDPKSHAIFRELRSSFEWVYGFLYQEIADGPRYKIKFSREQSAFLIGLLRPRAQCDR